VYSLLSVRHKATVDVFTHHFYLLFVVRAYIQALSFCEIVFGFFVLPVSDAGSLL